MTNSPDDPFAQQPGDRPQPGYNQSPPPPPPGSSPAEYSSPQYGAPSSQHAAPPYGQPHYGPRPGTEKNWMGITSLVLSLAGIITFFSVIGGIIFGHMSMSAAKKGQADNRGMGLAGLIIGYIFLALGILSIIAIFALVGWMSAQCTSANPPDWCSDPGFITLRDWFGG